MAGYYNSHNRSNSGCVLFMAQVKMRCSRIKPKKANFQFILNNIQNKIFLELEAIFFKAEGEAAI